MTENTARALIEATGVTKSYGGRVVLDPIDVSLWPGQILGVVGESGSGKSTLGRILLGLLDPDAGSVRFDGIDINRASNRQLKEIRARLQVVPQNPQTSLNPRLTIGDSLRFNMRAHGIARAEQERTITRLLDETGLPSDSASRYPHEMSGGQLQRVAIARALSTNPEVVVCDEAVSALDKSVQAQILNLIADLQRERNIAFLFISHDLAVVEHISDDVLVIYRGELVEYGPAARVWSDPHHPYTASLLAAIPAREFLTGAVKPAAATLRKDPQ